ncbi:DEAD/DEAH box helicase family protein [Candidatus Poriferisodalis sp.]|uniref:DEAD/DEAH box helicase family protein n=1 Tax=Candidatus Poriferisodalis sp. TaxID=3101277 RepID=UPI003B527232
MTFGSLFDSVRPAYEIPDDDLVGEILTPALCSADDARIAAGFFTSRCLAQIAGGLAAFINDSDAILDLMVSPEISAEDREAIRRGIREPEVVLEEALERLFTEARLSDSAVQRYTVETLAYLVASGRLRLRVVLMERGIYHKKIWLFRAGDEWLAVHGSGNATERGLLVNGEQMSIDRAWQDGPRSEARVQIFLEQWDRQWENRHPTALTVEVSQALDILRGYAADSPPTKSEFWKAWQLDHEAGLEPELPPAMRHAPPDHQLQIPNDLIWREGRFGHQGRAVDALNKGAGGIVAIATGGGKTLTALIAVTEMQHSEPRHICVVVLVPSRPLVRQWTEDIRAFGIDPVVLKGTGTQDRRAELERVAHGFATEQPRTEVVVMSNALFIKTDSSERRWLTSLPKTVELVLIADEVHNLGTPSFINDPPDFFTRRIGLSATPIRQYDPDGTDQLFDFFGGPPVFEFSLGDAIEAGCLVPYNYYLHVIELNAVEMEHYEFLTEELVRAGFRIDDDGVTVALNPKVERLLRERRGLIEQADAKLPALAAELRRMGTDAVTKTLIYTSAKPTVLEKPKQITAVNSILENLHVISHQYTSRETRSSRSERILERFGAGDYQVLTAMKVLDEGVDIPQTDTAFLLASSAVRREWVQRRGRILRQAPNKNVAHLHDFLVMPPDIDTSIGQSLLKSELRRAAEFASIAENEFDSDGPNEVIRDLEAKVWKDANA